jgi:hypothetical protein
MVSRCCARDRKQASPVSLGRPKAFEAAEMGVWAASEQGFFGTPFGSGILRIEVRRGAHRQRLRRCNPGPFLRHRTMPR